jgi:hypothetical protein
MSADELVQLAVRAGSQRDVSSAAIALLPLCGTIEHRTDGVGRRQRSVSVGDIGKHSRTVASDRPAASTVAREPHGTPGKTLKTKADTEQATALKGTLNIKDAMPGWTAEPMQKQIATVTLAGPTAKKDFEFTGKKTDGEEWIATFSDGVSTKIVAPKAPTAGYHNHSVQEAANAACFLPKSARSLITLIMLNPVVNPKDAEWAVTYNTPNFHSYMTAGVAGVVTIYPDKDTNALPAVEGQRSAIVHETGHTWSFKTWGQGHHQGQVGRLEEGDGRR